MKKRTSVLIGFMVVSGWLASNVAWGGPPPEPPRQGGIPHCEEQLLECAIDLAICESTTQTFPTTGQTSCWDSDGVPIDCAGTGQDGDIQAGAALSYTDTGLTIIDNNTKLEWMKQDDNGGDCASLPGSLDKDCTFTWDGAFAFVAQLNADNYDGGGWRVPNYKELVSILNLENSIPAVSAEFDTGCVTGCTVDTCSCTAAAGYWSSTSFAFNPGSAWVVGFIDGFVVGGSKNFVGPLRAVRGGL